MGCRPVSVRVAVGRAFTGKDPSGFILFPCWVVDTLSCCYTVGSLDGAGCFGQNVRRAAFRCVFFALEAEVSRRYLGVGAFTAS